MSQGRALSHAQLLHNAKGALLMSDEEIARVMGKSRRTLTRWWRGPGVLLPDDLQALARAVFPRNRELSAQLAAAGHTTLEGLGLVAKVVPPPPEPAPAKPDARLVEVVLCAAAEALDASPAVVRPALLQAFRRARELGLDLETVEAGLQPTAASTRSKKPLLKK